MSENLAVSKTLEKDAELGAPLKRVAYEAGMLLGLEATQDEQSYHRRRLNRHNYWLHGFGTLLGMVVAIDPPTSGGSDPILTRMTVSPGMGIDGLGREVLINEGYCIDLGEWLNVQTETTLRDGYDEVTNLLWLKVAVRYQECAVAQQPVLARKLNISTDAVQPSRTADSFILELSTELPPTSSDDRFGPWSVHAPVENDTPAELTDTERDYLDALALSDPDLHRQLQLQTRFLHALGPDPVSPQIAADELEESASILLARVSIDVADINDILNVESGDPSVNPNNIFVNNLVRPFLTTASQLAYLDRTP